MSQWYYAQGGTRIGPVEQDYFEELVEAGTITPDTLVWRKGMSDWQPLRVARLLEPRESAESAEQAQPADTQSVDASRAKSEPVRQAPENASPVSSQPAVTAEPGAATLRYGGFWLRLAAFMVDGMVMVVATVPITIVAKAVFATALHDGAAEGAALLLNLLAAGAYEVLLTAYRGATLGKMAVGLKVVAEDGSPVSLARSVGRWLAKFLNMLLFGLLYLVVAFEPRKRGIHDMAARTLVVHKD